MPDSCGAIPQMSRYVSKEIKQTLKIKIAHTKICVIYHPYCSKPYEKYVCSNPLKQ